MKIIIVGGHLAPALAIIDELKKNISDLKIVFVGRKYPLTGEKTLSLEYKEIKKRNIEFVNFETGRLTRFFSLKSIINFLKIPIGFIRAFFIIKKYQPDIILSFGGYLALPVVFWGYFFKSKIFTHEQTINPGLSNRIIAFFSKKIFVSFEKALAFFPKNKTILTGNPIRQSVFKIIKKPFLINKNLPVLYITGGSLGSHSINQHIKKIINKLLRYYIVIHQTGDSFEYQDYEILLKLRNELPKELSERYFLVKHFFDDEIGYIYSLTDFVIGRSGANTFFELIALEKPVIFIPLPWSAGKEQQYHAEIFAKAGCGEVFFQIEKSEKLLSLAKKIVDNLSFYKNNFKKLKSIYLKKNATQKIIKEIFS